MKSMKMLMVLFLMSFSVLSRSYAEEKKPIMIGVQTETLTFKLGQPIILPAKIENLPEGFSLLWDWDADPPLFIEEVNEGSTGHAWGLAGQHRAKLTALMAKVGDDGTLIFKKKKTTFVINIEGDKKPPPNPVNPDDDDDDDTPPPPAPIVVPEDEFNNLGRRIANWGNELFSSQEIRDRVPALAAIYTQAAERMLGELQPLIPTPRLAVAVIKGKQDELLGPSAEASRAWDLMQERVQAEAEAGWDKWKQARFYKAIGNGLAGVNLED